jgi:hypothetical protein
MAKAKKKGKKRRATKAPIKEGGRLNLIIDPKLKRWVKEYAARKHKNVTAIVTDHFVELREREGDPDASSI